MAKPDLLGIVARDMAESLRFYRLLDLEIPEGMDNEPHVEITLPGGLRIAWDTLELMQSIHPDRGRTRRASDGGCLPRWMRQ